MIFDGLITVALGCGSSPSNDKRGVPTELGTTTLHNMAAVTPIKAEGIDDHFKGYIGESRVSDSHNLTSH
jgi:hypothetical protein